MEQNKWIVEYSDYRLFPRIKIASFQELIELHDRGEIKITRNTLERIDTMDTEKEIEALKARIAKLEGKKDPYPCIKKHPGSGTVILFTLENEGVCLNQGDTTSTYLGEKCFNFNEIRFTETLTEYTIKV